MWRLTLFGFAAVVAVRASAQAPAITPAGDPPVRSDTIYKLAVNPANYPDQPIVWLLDDGVVRYDEQGRETKTYRKVMQVLKQEAAEQLSEQSFSYSPGHERQTINWIKVVKPNKDLSSPARIAFRIRNAKATEHLGDSNIFAVPLGGMGEFTALAADLEKEPKRRFPIDARRVLGVGTRSSEFRITLPDGWKAKLPSSVMATSAFGGYRSEYVQDGRAMRITRVFTGSKAILPPEKMPELIAWLRQIGKDDANHILLEGAPTTSK